MPRSQLVRGSIDEAVERSARPALVRAALERMTEQHPDLPTRLADDDQLREAIVAVLATSRSLTRLIETSPSAVDRLADLGRRAPVEAETVERLVEWKRHELLRIAARDLLHLDDLPATGAALARLADDVLGAACELAAGGLAPAKGADVHLAVIALGKLGGQELNYASDVDILFVGEGPHQVLERQARVVSTIARRCFRVDTTLRPEGRDGPLVRSLPSFEAYWSRWAHPWESQALLKARPAAGHTALGAAFRAAAGAWLWSRPFTADDLRSLRALKSRSEHEVAKRGLADRDVKRGRGGIRDIEFTVQLLQLVHGHRDPDLRGAATLPVLAELADAGYIATDDADRLAQAYRFLRAVEHRLQLDDEQQRHAVPVEAVALDVLARVLGFRGRPEADAAEQFRRALSSHQLAVRTIHERVYFRPLLEAFSRTEERLDGLGALSPDAAVTRLAAFGFTDASRTQAAVRELTRGMTRASRLMLQMLPLLLNWLSESPNPDLGLLMLRTLLTGSQRQARLVEAFRDSPEVARRLCTLVGTSRVLGDILGHHPDLIPRLARADQLDTKPAPELAASATAATAWRTDPIERQAALRRWKDRHLLGVAARDLLEEASIETVGTDLTAVADATVETALAGLDAQVPFAVLGLGRFGGAELSYASDLDVVFVFDGDGPEATAEALRVAGGLLRTVGGTTPADRLYRIDAGLRPEGRSGALARSLQGYERYFASYAQVWERQANSRARVVAGDRALGRRLLDVLEPVVWAPGLSDDDVREIRRLKARIERERIPVGEDPQFHLKLGRGSLWDIEFTAQLLQLRHGVRSPGTIGALGRLVEIGALDAGDAEVLVRSYRFCERTRNRWYLIDGHPRASLPTNPDQQLWLARSLDLTPTALREEYRRVTRRARRVVNRLFYGQEDPPHGSRPRHG